MVEVVIHYVTGGENLTTSAARDHQARLMELPRVPIAGEILTGHQGQYVELVSQVAYSRDGTPHVFVVPSTPAPHIAQGLKISNIGVPSLTAFEGRTIGDLIQFLAQYPVDQEVTFNDRQILVAKAKANFVVLRLDERDES